MNIDVWVGGRCYALNPIERMRRKVEVALNRAVDEQKFEAYLGLARYDLVEKFDEETLVKRVVERILEDDDET
jgi:hypothetical protein